MVVSAYKRVRSKNTIKRESYCRGRFHQTSELEPAFAEYPYGGEGDEETGCH